jgi:tRNA(Ile)-lysidine synthetase-like protein
MIKKRYILAISGGVDSVVLLDLATKWSNSELIVAHFDHGIRKDSASDAEFVKNLAKKYNVPFEMGWEALGNAASEDQARVARYNFLQRIARKYNAQIVTAHHKDDILETIIINLLRGTGWRGLCSLRSGDIYRPMLEMEKADIHMYATQHKLTWREDSTNANDTYLRNYIRHNLMPHFDAPHREKLFALYKEQCAISVNISTETANILQNNHNEGGYSRYLFIMADSNTAKELLYAVIYKETGKTAMRPQLERALLAVKTFGSYARYQVGGGVELRFSKAHMIVEVPRN